MDPVDSLLDLIQTEERRLLSTFSLERRIGLFELVRAADAWFAATQLSPGRGSELDQRSADQLDEAAGLLSFGLNKALQLFVDDSCLKDGAPLFASDPAFQRWADPVLFWCGRLGYCQRVLELSRVGLAEVTRSGPKKYQVRMTAERVGAEALEAAEFAAVGTLAQRLDGSWLQENQRRRNAVKPRMSELVAPWRENYIQYDTEPGIDDVYQEAAVLMSRHFAPLSVLPPDDLMGGIPFGVYQAALVTFRGWALKHIDFSQALLKKEPHLEFRNVTTISQSKDRLAEYLSGALDSSFKDAMQVLETMILGPHNKGLHTKTPGSVPPPLIQIGNNDVVASVYGGLSASNLFLGNELKSRYPRDWDKAVNSRESTFRDDLYHLFASPRYIKVARPRRIRGRDGGLLTDVDAVILDQATGSLGLFQLKWQDPFGNAMLAWRTRKGNFIDESNRWVAVVDQWVSSATDLEIATALGLPNEAVIRSRFLFVIGRNFSHFSGQQPHDRRAAWGLWPQLINLIAKDYDRRDPIQWMWASFRRESPTTKPVEWPMLGKEIRLGDHFVSIQPPSEKQLGISD